MIKKSLAALAVVGILTLGGASAAMADGYAAQVGCTANPNPIAVGATSVITCTGLQPNVTGTLTVTGPGVTGDTLSSIVFAGATGTDSVTKTTSAEGTVSVNFKGPAAGNYTVTLESQGQTGSATVTVTAASTGGGSGLPATGGEVPAAAIWLGVGAIGIGGIAVAAAVARRRASSER